MMDISRITLTNANEEYSKQLSRNCVGVILHARDDSVFRVAVEAGQVEPVGDCITIHGALTTLPISAYAAVSAITLYLAASTPGTVIEVCQIHRD